MIMAEPVERTEPELPEPEHESELVRRARKGDLAAYDDLVKRYQERIYATIYHMTSNHEDANDLDRTHMSLNDIDFNAEHDSDLIALISEKTPRREAGLNELQIKLNEALLKLSEPHRLVVVLHDVQGQSHEEIAEIMGCNIGTVRSRLFYARQQMQSELADYLK
jgi:RNA polymerase sigma-70 factor (ECF subfamily)